LKILKDSPVIIALHGHFELRNSLELRNDLNLSNRYMLDENLDAELWV
jgi:hypothetical protein